MVRTANSVPAHEAPSQTLERGLAILSAVAEAASPLSIADAAAAVGIHRSIAYRLLRTLEQRDLVRRDDAGLYLPSGGLAALARSVRLDLRSAARPALTGLADSLGMTAFLVVREGNEAVTIESAEPTQVDVHVVYRPGARHPIDRGAPGLALTMAAPRNGRERRELSVGRRNGWVRTTSEVIPGMASIAAPILAPMTDAAAIAVLWLSGQDVDDRHVGATVTDAASRIAALLH